MRDTDCTKDQLNEAFTESIRLYDQDPASGIAYAIESLDTLLSDDQLFKVLKLRHQLHSVFKKGLIAIAKDRGIRVPR